MMIPRATVLTTSRCKLRIPNETDIDFIFSATRYPTFNDGMPWEAPTEKASIRASLQRSLQRWDKGEGYSFTIVNRKNTIEQLGRVSIRVEDDVAAWSVGFWVHPKHQGKGVMTEALSAVLALGFEQLSAQKIIAQYATWNKASEKVLLRNGFKFSRHLAEGFRKRGQWVPENELMLPKTAWEVADPKMPKLDFYQRLPGHPNIIYEDEQLVALLDIDPIATGHLLICPKKHYPDFHDLPDHLAGEMMMLAKKYVKVLQKIFPTPGYSLLLNGDAYNDIGHCHLHVFPRPNQAAFGWTYSEEPLPPEATDVPLLKQLLASHLADG